MPDPPTLNTLCQECQSIFQGHWLCRDDVENESQKEMDSIGAEGEQKGCLSSGSEKSSDDDSDFYEKPDWVKSISVDRARELSQQTRLFFSPLHHSVKDLEVSAQSGCHLCTLFWDQLSDNLKNTTKVDETRLQQAKGLIIVRPRPSSLEENIDRQAPQPLLLAVSYFVDGNCERQSSYIMSIEFDIYVTDSTSQILANATLS